MDGSVVGSGFEDFRCRDEWIDAKPARTAKNIAASLDLPDQVIMP